MSLTAPRNSKSLIILLHLGFFLSGILTVIVGPLLPILSNRFTLNDLQSGYFFSAQFSGSLCGTFLTNWFGKKNKFIIAALLGCFLMGSGVALLNFNVLAICLLGCFINGVGIGLTLPSINMLILELNPHKPTSAVNLLNFFWGLGAIFAKPFVDIFSDGKSLFLITSILTSLLFFTSIFLLFNRNELTQKTFVTNDSNDDFSTPIWTTWLAWLIAFFNFIHVGYESATGGWLTTYGERIANGQAISWLSPTFLFFLFFVVGRGFAPIFTRLFNENQMLLINLIIAATGSGILLLANDIFVLSVGASIAGFGTSSVFPTNMSRFTKTFGASASRRAMPFFICGTLGATFTTWLIGFTSNYFNNLNSGMFILLGSCLLLIVLQSFLMFRQTKTLS